MADLAPVPFGRLAARMARELEINGSLFDLPRRSFYLGDPDRDFSVKVHGLKASSPLGPAAGPQTQLAQNIVLCWLGGARVMELKTVQILDRLALPRPCIDMRSVGYNVEWSQELTLEQSLEEYVKASMLIDILQASGLVRPHESYRDVVFDLSVGYDLAGIQNERVRAFIAGMKDARPTVDRLRGALPEELKAYRGLDFRTKIAETVTLSTFHGCPPGEIEKIAEFLLGPMELSCTVKLNPTLLGQAEVVRLLNDALGYRGVQVPPAAFAADTTWDQAAAFVGRLEDRAKAVGRGFGVKFCNTLVVANPGDFLPKSEATAYLSGAPLHVLAIALVRRFRAEFGERVPVSFSGGINRYNFPDAVSLGLVPVTTCSDLLGPGGYGRLRGYMEELGRRMEACGARDLPAFALKARGGVEAAPDKSDARYRTWVSHAKRANTEAYAAEVERDPRYAKARNTAAPKKVGSVLSLFDCLTCDKCVSACPNDANFVLPMPLDGPLKLKRKHQLANFADVCNECGNCDVFCPEDGGPYRLKPRFFGSLEAWEAAREKDGFFASRSEDTEFIHGRLAGREYRLSASGGRVQFTGKDVKASVKEDENPQALAEDLRSIFHIMNSLRKAIFSKDTVNYVNS